MLEHNKVIIKIGWKVRRRKQTIRLAASNKESRTWKSETRNWAVRVK